MVLHVLTIATSTRPELAFLLTSAAKHGITPVLLGMGNPRLSYLQRDYSLKIELFQSWIREKLGSGALSPRDLVVCTDAFDVVFIGGPDAIIGGWEAAGSPPILFSAEKNLWPQEHLRSHFDRAAAEFGGSSPYRYINAGTYMGLAASLLAFWDRIPGPIKDADDQGLLQTVWANDGPAMGATLDYYRQVFYVPVFDGMDKIYSSKAPIVHFAGGENFGRMGEFFRKKFPDALQPQYNSTYWLEQQEKAATAKESHSSGSSGAGICSTKSENAYREATIGLAVGTVALLIVCITLTTLVVRCKARTRPL